MFLEVDLSQNIVDVDFTNFCVVYTWEGIANQLTTSLQSNQSKGKGKQPCKYTLDINLIEPINKEGSAYEQMSLSNSSYHNGTLATEADDGSNKRGIMASAN